MPVFYKDKSQNPLDKCITKEDLSENSIATMFSGFIQEKNVDTMKQIFQGMVGNGEVFTKEDLDLFVNNALKQRNALETFIWASHFNISNENNEICKGNNLVSKIESNVLILHGDKDQTCPLAGSEKLEVALKGKGILKIFKGGDHSFPLNSRFMMDETMASILDFLK